MTRRDASCAVGSGFIDRRHSRRDVTAWAHNVSYLKLIITADISRRS